MGSLLPPGTVGRVGATIESSARDGDTTAFRFTVIVEPFSEFAEVTDASVSFTLGPNAISEIFFDEMSERAERNDMPATPAALSQLADEIRVWISRVLPSAPELGPP